LLKLSGLKFCSDESRFTGDFRSIALYLHEISKSKKFKRLMLSYEFGKYTQIAEIKFARLLMSNDLDFNKFD